MVCCGLLAFNNSPTYCIKIRIQQCTGKMSNLHTTSPHLKIVDLKTVKRAPTHRSPIMAMNDIAIINLVISLGSQRFVLFNITEFGC